MESRNKFEQEAEEIFGAHFEEPKDEFLEETIRKIESYGACYDPDSDLSAFNQLQICEAVEKATPITPKPPQKCSSVKCINGTNKRKVNSELTQNKQQEIITELRKCTYRTPPHKIAALLEALFSSYSSKPGHWLYIAQNWTPRVVNWVLNYMVKLIKTGRTTIKNPAAYFTKLIKYRKKRKERRGSNGT